VAQNPCESGGLRDAAGHGDPLRAERREEPRVVFVDIQDPREYRHSATHSHPDNRSCFVLSGLWYFGYGSVRSEAGLKALPPGSHYTEPAGTAHFAGTQGQEAVLECTAVGPAGTTFVNPADAPKP